MTKLLDGYETSAGHLANVTVRAEQHGEEVEPGCTLKITMTCPNTILDLFADGLRASLYTAEGEQKELGLDEGYLPTRRFPLLGTIPWSQTLQNRKLTIKGGRRDVVLEKCELKKFAFHLQEGGSVVVSFNANCHPDDEEAGQLYMLTGQDIELEIEAGKDEDPQQQVPDGETKH